MYFNHVACPEGVEFCNVDAQVYYEFVNPPGNVAQSEAKAACVAYGGQLAVLDTDEKIAWMKEVRGAQPTNSYSKTSDSTNQYHYWCIQGYSHYSNPWNPRNLLEWIEMSMSIRTGPLKGLFKLAN